MLYYKKKRLFGDDMSSIILHSDLNCFCASVECLLNPDLRGKPIAVCGASSARRGIFLAKSQEAKVCGVKTGLAIWEAKRLVRVSMLSSEDELCQMTLDGASLFHEKRRIIEDTVDTLRRRFGYCSIGRAALLNHTSPVGVTMSNMSEDMIEE